MNFVFNNKFSVNLLFLKPNVRKYYVKNIKRPRKMQLPIVYPSDIFCQKQKSMLHCNSILLPKIAKKMHCTNAVHLSA